MGLTLKYPRTHFLQFQNILIHIRNNSLEIKVQLLCMIYIYLRMKCMCVKVNDWLIFFVFGIFIFFYIIIFCSCVKCSVFFISTGQRQDYKGGCICFNATRCMEKSLEL